MDLLRLGLFVLFSLLLVGFTLWRKHRYRFFRLMAFECLLALVFVNSEYWFQSPFSIRQLFSWAFLVGSLLLALHGFWVLRTFGAPERDLEETTQLVVVGAYRYIRHPLYGSLILCGIGAILKSISIIGLSLLGSLIGFLYATAKVEEKDNLQKFGEAYQTYTQNTRMFIPYLI